MSNALFLSPFLSVSVLTLCICICRPFSIAVYMFSFFCLCLCLCLLLTVLYAGIYSGPHENSAVVLILVRSYLQHLEFYCRPSLSIIASISVSSPSPSSFHLSPLSIRNRLTFLSTAIVTEERRLQMYL